MINKFVLQNIPAVVYYVKGEIQEDNVKIEEIKFLNDYIQDLTGFSFEEIKKDPYWWFKHIYPEDLDYVIENTKRIFQQETLSRSYRVQKKDGSYLWVKDTVRVLKKEDNKVEIIGIWENVTEEKHLFEVISSDSPVGIFLYREKFVFANKEMQNQFGYSLEEFKNMYPWEIVSPELREKIKSIVKERLEGKRFGQYYNELPMKTKSGKMKYCKVYTNTVLIDSKPHGLAIVIDITKEKEYRKSLELDSFVLENIGDAVIIRDFETLKPVYVNKTASKIFGYSKEEVLTKRLEDLVTPESLSKKDTVLKNLLDKGYFVFESEMVKKDKTVFPAEVHSQLINIEGKKYIISILRDITEKNKTIKKIQNLSRLYRTLSEINQILIYSKSEEEVFNNICEVVVKHCGFKFSWIGLLDEKKEVINPVSYYGKYPDYIKSIKISLKKNDETSKGPTVQAAIQNKVIINPDTRTNPVMKPWREQQLKLGFLSSVAIPFEKNGKIYGVLNLYSGEPGFFDKDFLNLFKEIKTDISFVLNKLENDKWKDILDTAINEGVDWVLITDPKGKILYANKAVEKISQYKLDEIIGKHANMFESGYQSKSLFKKVWRYINAGETFEGIFINRKKNGELFYLNSAIIPVFINGKLTNIVETGKDITQEKFLEDELKKISFYDVLTKLPNRNLFVEEISNYLERAKHENQNAAILIIDLNKFSYINNTYGYNIGDEYLKSFARKLKKIFRKGDIISRIGNDEFGILLEDLADKKHILLVLEKIKEELLKPITIKGNNFIFSYNIGIAIFPDDGEDAETLLKQADIALSSAKTEGENEYKFYENVMNQKASEFLILKKHMVDALKNENFLIYYQPYFDAKTQELKGFEALLRWKLGSELISPAKFIPILEETGLIREVEQWIIKEVCKNLNIWKSKGYKLFPVSINISPVSFKKENFLEKMLKIVEDNQINPELITFEITENSFIDNFKSALVLLKRIKETGFKISIDDFGTGYSSLSYLRNIPADILKIDISFIKDIVDDPYDLAVVETIINLSKKLNMKTIAEGVEKQEQLELLKSINCDMVQGFLLSKPLPVEEVNRYLSENML